MGDAESASLGCLIHYKHSIDVDKICVLWSESASTHMEESKDLLVQKKVLFRNCQLSEPVRF